MDKKSTSYLQRYWQTKAGLYAAIFWARGSHFCGYVRVPESHPLFGVPYSEVNESLRGLALRNKDQPTEISALTLFTATIDADEELGFRLSPDVVLDVHGGITYSSGSQTYPVSLEGPVWWYGFDCAHAGDKQYGRMEELASPDDVFRDEQFCIRQCEKLANQLAFVAKEETDETGTG